MLKNAALANLKLHGDIDKLKNVPTNSSNSKSEADKVDVDKLVPIPVDLSKLNIQENSCLLRCSFKQKQVSTGSLQNSCFKQFLGELPGRPTSVLSVYQCTPP